MGLRMPRSFEHDFLPFDLNELFVEFGGEFVERDYLVTGVVDQFFQFERFVEFRPYVSVKAFEFQYAFFGSPDKLVFLLEILDLGFHFPQENV